MPPFFFFFQYVCQMITLDEFRDGCERLNANLHPDCQLTDIEHTLEMMDFDKSGTIDINEFFEVELFAISCIYSVDLFLTNFYFCCSYGNRHSGFWTQKMVKLMVFLL